MAKASVIMKSGTKVTIEGESSEVAALVRQIEGEASPSGIKPVRSRSDGRTRAKQKPTPINLISSLIDGGFFKKPKDLGVVKVALEEMGHYYPVTTLSPALLRLVRKRQLRRIRDKKRWLYTG